MCILIPTPQQNALHKMIRKTVKLGIVRYDGTKLMRKAATGGVWYNNIIAMNIDTCTQYQYRSPHSALPLTHHFQVFEMKMWIRRRSTKLPRFL